MLLVTASVATQQFFIRKHQVRKRGRERSREGVTKLECYSNEGSDWIVDVPREM